MDANILAIDDDHSPLHRIMSIFDFGHSTHQKFTNNICAFHIGNGYILSVAHNLRIQEALPPSIPARLYLGEILPKLSQQDQNMLNSVYGLDSSTNKYHLSSITQQTAPSIVKLLESAGFDRRYIRMYENDMCEPYLIVQFREDRFYTVKEYSNLLPPGSYLAEPGIGRHTFKIRLEIIKALYEEDWSIYRIRDLSHELISLIPKFDIDYSLYKSLDNNYYCLQVAPIDNLGRLLNKASIDGILDHFNIFRDSFGGNYLMQGLRYLISGYFRFGSSGAPYLKYNRFTRRLRVNAIQSEACPLQLTINNNREGNFQYVNGIASPIANIKKHLLEIL